LKILCENEEGRIHDKFCEAILNNKNAKSGVMEYLGWIVSTNRTRTVEGRYVTAQLCEEYLDKYFCKRGQVTRTAFGRPTSAKMIKKALSAIGALKELENMIYRTVPNGRVGKLRTAFVKTLITEARKAIVEDPKFSKLNRLFEKKK